MNTKHMFAAVAFLAAGSACAGDIYPYVDHSKFTGTRTRAEVQAELNGAGAIASRQPEFVEFADVAADRTRDEVRAELARAYAEGNHVAGGASEFVEFGRVASTRSRAEVREEAAAAREATAESRIAGL
ncbi:MAG TPA: DUF4148 domain-containing protein [Noviherbaspirillum sp.]|jgi:hypothetical protein|uniref:DUF4148 domain-containing protein n=1 Tax=Noviherbaspirillum sp. TaxID=1926288 RepID=UPI002F95219E